MRADPLLAALQKAHRAHAQDPIAFERRCYRLFADGFDSVEIAAATNEPEAIVERSIEIGRQAVRS